MSTEGSLPAGATVEAVVEAPTAAAGAGRRELPAKVKMLRHFYGIAPKSLSPRTMSIWHRKSQWLSPPTRSHFKSLAPPTGSRGALCHRETGGLRAQSYAGRCSRRHADR